MILGTAGGSLVGATWAAIGAAGAERGRRGELATAAALDPLCLSDLGPSVLHDLSIPGLRAAQVDHVVVSGRRVLLIDTKVWKAGTYLGWGDLVVRNTGSGYAPFPHAAPTTLAIAREKFAGVLPARARLVTPLVVVHCASEAKSLRLAMRHRQARFITARALPALVKTRMHSAADRDVVSALSSYVRRDA